MEYIKFSVKYTDVTNKERKLATIYNLESNVDYKNRNELPVILNVLSYNTNLIIEDANKGFPYKFPFKLR